MAKRICIIVYDYGNEGLIRTFDRKRSGKKVVKAQIKGAGPGKQGLDAMPTLGA